MDGFTLFTLAVGLSMDAFAVSICKGLAMGKVKARHCAVAGLWFGGFQAGMPLIGYLLGSQFQDKITAIDHWIAFVLLGLIGANMVREALSGEEGDCPDASLAPAKMLVLAVAVSAVMSLVYLFQVFLKKIFPM